MREGIFLEADFEAPSSFDQMRFVDTTNFAGASFDRAGFLGVKFEKDARFWHTRFGS